MKGARNDAPPAQLVRVRPVLTIASFTSLSGALLFRTPDPVIPQVRFRTIFSEVRAGTCYFPVALEGALLFGLLRYAVLLLYAAGEEQASIADGEDAAGFGYGAAANAVQNRFGPVSS